MKYMLALMSVLLAVCAASVSLVQYAQRAQAEAGWIVLFDGKSLDNWNPIGSAKWRLEDGSVVVDSGNGFLVSKGDYDNFDLRVEFWIESKTNSGVFIRGTDPNDVTGKTAYEVNIWDTRPEPNYGTGAIVGVAAVDPMPTAGGKWNLYEIIAEGNTFNVIPNGQKTVVRSRADKAAIVTGLPGRLWSC